MRVLIWSQYFWPENFHINAVARSLHEQGVDVTVLTGKPNYPAGEIFPGYRTSGIQRDRHGGVEVIRIPLIARGNGSAFKLALNYLSFILSGFIFAPIALRGKKFDAIFVYAPSPLLQAIPAISVSWIKRAPIILWVQDLWPEALLATGYVRNQWILRLVGLGVRYVYHFSDLILIQSEAFRVSVERYTRKKKEITYYPNSAESCVDDCSKRIGNTQLAKDISKSFSIVFAGNIGSVQSCETIIQAAKLLKEHEDIKFFIVGSGSMMLAIQSMIDANDLKNVFMPGRIAADEMPSIYSAASVLLLSLADNPALSATVPSKLQSYLAAGKPIIASCNGVAADIVRKANAGMTSPAGDADALKRAVLDVYRMPQESRSRLGENAKLFFKANYFLPHKISELIEHFEWVISEQKASKDIARMA